MLRLLKIAVAVSSIHLMGCGAPTKSAGEVSHIFGADSSLTLQDKLYNLCNTLASRDEGPTLKDLPVDMFGCANAGLAAVDYRSATSFYFAGLDDPKDSGDFTSIDGRGQVWLNKSLIGLASAASGLMKQKAGAGGTEGGLVSLPDSSDGGVGGLLTPVITQKSATLDPESIRFASELNFKATGALDINLDLGISGALIENSIAVTVKTLNDVKKEESPLIKGIDVVIVIVPHAGDIYLDMFVSLKLFKVGFIDGLIEEQINSFLGTGLKSVIDTAMQL